jgi:Spy/CpxP family protein refolding chaperone
MNKIVAALLLSGMVTVGASAFADDTSPSQNPNPKQQMKDCMNKAHQSNNGMSEQDMQKSCRAQIAANIAHPDQQNQPITPAH